MLQEFLYVLKAAALCKAVHVASLVYKFFLRPGNDLRKHGEWAVVTGCTSGIGRAYSFELAKMGFNIVLLSRSEESLASLEKELKTKFSTLKIEHLAVDFGKFDANAQVSVKKKLTDLDIGLLINNVGASYPFTKYFHELKDDEIAGMIDVNVTATTFMTRLVLGDVDGELPPKVTSGMLARKRGAIVNISSALGRINSPLVAEYSGSKAYVHMFSKSLAAELAPKGIHVQCQFPLFVVSNMSKIRKASLTVPSPETYVKTAIKFIGHDTIISPIWTHSLQMWIIESLPEFIGTKIIMSMHQSIRSKGYKKMQRELDESKKAK